MLIDFLLMSIFICYNRGKTKLSCLCCKPAMYNNLATQLVVIFFRFVDNSLSMSIDYSLFAYVNTGMYLQVDHK